MTPKLPMSIARLTLPSRYVSLSVSLTSIARPDVTLVQAGGSDVQSTTRGHIGADWGCV